MNNIELARALLDDEGLYDTDSSSSSSSDDGSNNNLSRDEKIKARLRMVMTIQILLRVMMKVVAMLSTTITIIPPGRISSPRLRKGMRCTQRGGTTSKTRIQLEGAHHGLVERYTLLSKSIVVVKAVLISMARSDCMIFTMTMVMSWMEF